MIITYQGHQPKIAESAFVAPSADLIGKVFIEEDASIWFQVVARGDVNSITIGKGSNIQDGSVCHVSGGEVRGITYPLNVGNYVTVGHNVTLHGCTIKDHCIIGMGSTLLDGAVIGENCIVAAGSLVPPGKVYESGSMIMGSPAKVVRPLKENELMMIKENAQAYVELSKKYI